MRRMIIYLLASLFILAASAPAWAASPETSPKVLTAASKNRIDIGLFYKGDRVHFFGVNPVPGSDLIIRLTAAKDEELKLSMKGRVGPFWMTVKQYAVTGAPFIYKIHASKPIKDIISAETAQELELGFPAIKKRMEMHLIRGEAAPEDADLVFTGLLKIKKDANLYNIEEGAERLEITEGKLFSHYFRFPPAATEGKYLVESFSFTNGELVGYGKDEISISKVGLEAWLTNAAQNYPLAYGIGAVLFAMGAGLLVGMIFKKGGHH
jgi:uncharacterized protein (TIGR02186 family)